ncbi:MAG TPA: hypothetical protein VHE36_04690 [Sphingomicrobium sp.]|nr:hypothetical protein [Sphingomicrobium sp.]
MTIGLSLLFELRQKMIAAIARATSAAAAAASINRRDRRSDLTVLAAGLGSAARPVTRSIA